jgi:hypothetical protein
MKIRGTPGVFSSAAGGLGNCDGRSAFVRFEFEKPLAGRGTQEVDFSNGAIQRCRLLCFDTVNSVCLGLAGVCYETNKRV